jgi:undecaprenyl-diphosphatase
VYVFRLLVGVALVLAGVALLLIFENGLLGVREDFATMQAGWPEWLVTGIEVTFALGILSAVLGTNIYLLYRRLFRRWMLINLAAITAVFLGAAASHFVLSIATSDALSDAIETSSQQGLGNDGLASLVAVLTIGSVWIGPRLRPWAVGLTAVAASFSFLPGALSLVTLPFDVGVGMVAGAIVALVLETRDRTPDRAAVAETLGRDGITVREVHKASVDARGSVPWFATTADGDQLFVKTLNSDQRAADLMFRIYRMVRLRRAGDRRPFSSLRRSVEHEAFLSLAAEARQIRTPQLVTVTDVGSDGMLLAYRRIDGRSLDGYAPDEITDSMLAAVWSLVVTLRGAAIAHRDLRLANIFVDDDGVPWLIDFGFAELAADQTLLARDYAELLASTSAVVGAERAVTVAVDVAGAEGIAQAIPWIQPLALSSATRSQIGRTEGYEQLRTVAAAAVGIDDVEFEKVERVRPGTLLILGSVAVALYVLIPQLASATGFLDELTSADLRWAAVAIAASAATYLGAGLGMVGAIPMRLSLGSVTMAQLASSFSNRVTPAKVGGMATNVRFLQKKGIPLATSASAVGLNTVAGIVVHVSLLLLLGAVASRTVEVPLPDAKITGLVVGGLILVSGLLMLLPIGRRLLTRYLVPAMRAGLSSVVAIARTPSKLLALFAGSAVVTVGYTAAMLASLAAFGADVSVVTAAVVYLAGAAVATAAPTPGGIGATEAALVAGYTAVGVDASTAFAAVLLFRLVTFWLPILPGWLALVHLQRTGRL